jgi:hypothetical protein
LREGGGGLWSERVTSRVVDPGPIPHAEIERYDDPDVETGLEQAGLDPDAATYRLVEIALEDVEDTKWFPGPVPWGDEMVNALRLGAIFPPIVVVAKGEGYGLIDGLNRTYAHWVLRRPVIRAYELLH